MKSLLLFLTLAFVAACPVQAVAESVTVKVETSAQDDACEMARTGILRHRGRCSCVEGIGTASTREAAIKRCCFWGTRVVASIGVCQSRLTGRWFAVVRYR